MASDHDSAGITRFVGFASATPAEVFGKAARWLSEREGEATVTAVSWNPLPQTADCGLLVHRESA